MTLLGKVLPLQVERSFESSEIWPVAGVSRRRGATASSSAWLAITSSRPAHRRNRRSAAPFGTLDEPRNIAFQRRNIGLAPLMPHTGDRDLGNDVGRSRGQDNQPVGEAHG